MDADGDIDFATFGGQNILALGDGTGRFTDGTATRLPAVVRNTFDVALGDVDGDGDFDIVFGNDGQQNDLLLNNGSGTFAAGGSLPAATNSTRLVYLVNLDGDGDLDLFEAVQGGQDALLLIIYLESAYDLIGASLMLEAPPRPEVALAYSFPSRGARAGMRELPAQAASSRSATAGGSGSSRHSSVCSRSA